MGKAVLEKGAGEEVITVLARKGDKLYIAECKELGLYTQGETWEELVKNVREAVELSVEDDRKSIDDFKITIIYKDFV